MNKQATLLILIALGLAYLGMIKIAIITGIATIATHYADKKQRTSGSSNPNSSDVKVQPIKVKRKWDEDIESIYPEEMEIDMSPAKTGMKDELGDSLENIGKIIGNIATGDKDES